MSSNLQRVAVLGASGTVGRAVVAALLASKFEVTVLSRSLSTTTFPDAVKIFQVDYSDSDGLVRIFAGQDAIISAVAPFGIADQKIAIDAAVKAGVKRFVPSEYGLDTSRPDIAKVAPFAIKKQEIAKYLQSKESEGLTWTSVCSSAFFPWQLELGSGKMGWDIANQRATLFDSGNVPYDATTVPQLARALVAVLQHAESTANQYVYIRSFRLTQLRVLEALQRHSGRKYKISHASTLDSRKEGMELIEKGDLKNGYPKITTAVAFGPEGMGYLGGKEEKWMKLLGLQDEEDSFEELVKDTVRKRSRDIEIEEASKYTVFGGANL